MKISTLWVGITCFVLLFTHQNSTCQTTTFAQAKVQSYKTQDQVSKYRCDGFYNGIVSEWLEVTFGENKINSIVYWNTKDTKRQKLTIVKQKYTDGEMAGFTGSLTFPNSKDIITFGAVEDKFNLTHSGDRFQEFEMESE